MKRIRNYIVKVPTFIFVGVIIVMSVVPILWVLVSSFKLNPEILSSTFDFPTGLHIQNYVNAFRVSPIAKYYMNSFFVSITATVLNLVVMGMAGYVIARASFKLKRFFRAMFSLALLVPGAALLIPLYTTIKAVGLYDTRLGLILVYAGFGIPTTLFIVSGYFMAIPRELEESAYIDGSGFLNTFIKIIVPLGKPAFATAGVLQFLTCWNEFQFAMTLTTGHESRTLPVALYYFKSAFASDYGAMFAATVMISLPSIIIYILMQKQIVTGLTGGAVKG
ncbi:carbohydrate ABC transporter permease [Ohessyouella blattaphilus]|uniref:Carbohydrate ABC transporter permease n=1 Tax=Ohessyouella blattaphilus TaxID=2949333 RepID=A0ABT1EKQ1_9FIRM|nr:carbohydrate ABC transporter permease [Ohessyouella blattaphilus]MCP1111279.1 carbohydrate ABC transporter permease [Ohessyouella blattaphilus]MCR8564673.1 carbohydrate ABC transporter permease [Ohessyouella blattaphilus]MDL2249720.1 carbohydrate ABC transporter permease [Lachnospiraceae bacterium OttesenSCG-928-J05]